jgi:REP element-mobilizing transposase RayT
MPRHTRIDIPGIMRHVIVSGIDRCDFFLDDHDKQSFVNLRARIRNKTSSDCLACALMNDHFHLLLRPSRTKFLISCANSLPVMPLSSKIFVLCNKTTTSAYDTQTI